MNKLNKINKINKIISYHYSQKKYFELLKFILHSFFLEKKVYIYKLNLSNITKNLDNYKLIGYEIRRGDIEFLRKIRSQNNKMPYEFYVDNFDNVLDCLLVCKENEIIHISWLFKKNDPNKFLRLEKDEVEVKYSYTKLEHRGKNIFPYVLRQIKNTLSMENYKNLYICVDEDNIASQRAVSKLNFRFIGRLKYIKILSFQFVHRFKSL